MDLDFVFKSGSGVVISGRKLGTKRLCGMGIGHRWLALLAGPCSGAMALFCLPRERATSISTNTHLAILRDCPSNLLNDREMP